MENVEYEQLKERFESAVHARTRYGCFNQAQKAFKNPSYYSSITEYVSSVLACMTAQERREFVNLLSEYMEKLAIKAKEEFENI